MTDITARLRRLYRDTGINYVQEAADRIEALAMRVRDAERWRESVLDQCMIAHTTFYDDDPKKTLDTLIDWHVKVALDPQVSAEVVSVVTDCEGPMDGMSDRISDLLPVGTVCTTALKQKETKWLPS